MKPAYSAIALTTTLSIAASCVGFGGMTSAWANPAQPSTSPSQAQPVDALYPLEARQLEIEPDDTLMTTAASQINSTVGSSNAQGVDILDAIGSPELDALIDGLVDENGDVALPLGLTVFETMGDPSVGFGGRF
ncbi:MAG: hypothetical protein AAGF66_06860 [Cyanobacteria bacterium P01_H01_bin.119]